MTAGELLFNNTQAAGAKVGVSSRLKVGSVHG